MPDQATKKSSATKEVKAAGDSQPGSKGEGTRKAKAASGKTKPVKAAPPANGEPTDPKEVQALKKENKQLVVRIKELELDRTKGTRELVEFTPGLEGVAQQSQGILRIVKDLETQLDDAFSMTEALEADLEDVQDKLVKETGQRSELQAHVQLLEAKASLLEQLQDELSFVEGERTETAQKLGETETELEEAVKERDSLAERIVAADARINDLEQANVDLEAQVLNLEEKTADLGKVKKELKQLKGVCDELTQQVKDMTARLGASEISQKALELDLSTSQEVVSDLKAELEDRQEKLGVAQVRIVESNDRLEEEEFENRALKEANRRFEQNVKSLKAKNEVIGAELEATKRALHEIHSAATLTTKRIHSRYYESNRPDKE